MTKIVKKEESTTLERTPVVIAAEIRGIDQQTREIVMRSAIEIGRRLVEAKELVPHGEWGKWLEENVSYKQSTANNFMRIAKEYAGSNLEALGSLSYTQAVALLSLPSDEREQFVEENNVSDMSSRELQAAIKEKQELEQKLKDEQDRLLAEQQAREEEQRKREELEQQYKAELALRQKQEETLAQLQAAAAETKDDKAMAKVKEDLKITKQKAADANKRIKELEEQLKAKPIDVPATVEVQVVPEETKQELETLRKREQELQEQAKQREEAVAKQLADMQELLRKNDNTAAIKVKVQYETLVHNFTWLLAAVSELEIEEQRSAIQGRIAQLCDEMKGSL